MLARIAIACLVLVATESDARGEERDPGPLEVMTGQAQGLLGLVKTRLARDFLAAVPGLPTLESPRVVYYDPESRDARSEEDASGLAPTELERYERREFGEEFYWFTKYGTPLAFVRPLELLGAAGLETAAGARIVDFGFGSIGPLRILASLGADAVGVDVDPLLEALYSAPADTGDVPLANGEGGDPGSVRLAFGGFPGEAPVVAAVGEGVTAFISKNTLKNGYVHPAEAVDPRLLVDLGVGDAEFVTAVHRALAPGGFFLVYNLCPAQREDRYLPWADGRCPFDRDLLVEAGFEVLAYDEDDTEAARTLGRALGWAERMDLESDLFGIYSLFRKRR